MRRVLLTSLAALASLAGGPAAAGAPQVTLEILETDPQGPAVLHASDDVYVRVRYRADAPVRIWVRPYLHGAPAAAMTGGSPVYPAGEGEAFGWFSFAGRGS